MPAIKIQPIEGWPIQEVETDHLTQEQAQEVIDQLVDKLTEVCNKIFETKIA